MAGTSIGWIAFKLLIVLLLVVANGFFVTSEFALVSVRRSRISALANNGHRGARAVLRLLEKPAVFISATQFGVTLASLGLGWIGEASLASGVFIPLFTAMVPSHLAAHLSAHAVAVAVAFAAVTFLEIVLGEITPKTLALQRTASVALVIARPIELFCRVFRPLISFLNLSSVLPLRMLGLQPAFVNRLVYSPEELRHIISTSHKGGFLTDHERRMIQNMFDFTGKVVREVMVPRPEVAAIESTLDLRAAVSSFIDNGYSRMPVYEGRIDNIAGVVHSKDLMAHFPASGSFDLKAIARKPLFVPDTASLSEALAQMQSSKSHFGIVVDEHGGFEGIVTLEDLLEEIVGEIEDEYDEGENLDLVRTEPDGSLTVAGSITVRDANSLLKLGIPESDDYATLAGFLLSRAGKILSKGDHVDFDSAIFAIEQVERRRVVRIRITRPAGPKSPADAETSSESPASVVATD